MIKRLTVICGLCLVLAAPALGQEDGGEQQAAMEAWNKAMTPGEVHAFLARRTGQWKIAGKMWTTPGADPVASESTGEAEMILGGRYLVEKMTGDIMGMPFEGMGITGYDNDTGIVTSVWYDNVGTMTLIATGAYANPGDPLEVTGTMLDPMLGKEKTLRMVTTFISDDESRFDYYESMAGMPETKTMELHYSRVK